MKLNMFDNDELDNVSINFINTKLNNLTFYIKEFKVRFNISEDLNTYKQIINFKSDNHEIKNNFDYFIKDYIDKFPNEISNLLKESFNPKFIIESVMSINKEKFLNIINPMDLSGFNDIKINQTTIIQNQAVKINEIKELELELF